MAAGEEARPVPVTTIHCLTSVLAVQSPRRWNTSMMHPARKTKTEVEPVEESPNSGKFGSRIKEYPEGDA